jgi:hypothetical protein
MSTKQQAPGGLSWSAFEATALDAGEWLWGTATGAFNQKASLSQIIVDALIGMLPLVGDVTAVRDLTAVSIRLVDQPEARDDKWEWVLLAVLVLALVPVLGGVAKGVGRIVIKVAGESAHLAAAARAAKMAEAARDIVAFLNRIGVGNAERWLLKLRFADHQAAILERFNAFLYTINGALVQIERKLGSVLGQGMLGRIHALMNGIGQLKLKAADMIPAAIKELDATLREIQQYIRSGGQTTSRITSHTVAAGDKAAITYTEELRLTEGMSAKRSARGGVQKNRDKLADVDAEGFYKPEPGYPDLKAYAPGGKAQQVATFGGKIVNRPLAKGEQIFRVFGPEGSTHGAKVGHSYAPGSSSTRPNFWGIEHVPTNAKDWRETSAVLDEWNRDSFIIVGTVQEADSIKACTGKIAEQGGDKIPGQYLPGGGKQAMLQLPEAVNERLRAVGEQVIASGVPQKFEMNGVAWEIKPTGWKDANGIHGYELVTLKAGIQTARLGAREQATKTERDTAPQGQH